MDIFRQFFLHKLVKISINNLTIIRSIHFWPLRWRALTDAVNVRVCVQGGPQQRATVSMPGTNCTASAPTQPLSMALLDSLTIHAKMSLIHAISVHISKAASQQRSGGATVALPPALVETYSRLLVYPEMDTLGIKNLTSKQTPLPSIAGIFRL